MSDFLPSDGLYYPADTISQDDLFNLGLLQKDKVSDLLFLIGTLLGIYANTEAEQEIVCPEKSKASGRSEAEKSTSRSELIVVVILLFLAAAIILTYTAYARLGKQVSELDKEPDMTILNNISGSKLNILGLLLRIAGYTLSAVGNQIKADNPV